MGWAQTYHHTRPQDEAPAGYYLGGVTVDPEWRRRGVAAALTQVRMGWIARRSESAYYVVNPRNRASIALHRPWSFEELIRSDRQTGIEFTGGAGILFRARLRGMPRGDAPGDRASDAPAGSPRMALRLRLGDGAGHDLVASSRAALDRVWAARPRVGR